MSQFLSVSLNVSSSFVHVSTSFALVILSSALRISFFAHYEIVLKINRKSTQTEVSSAKGDGDLFVDRYCGSAEVCEACEGLNSKNLMAWSHLVTVFSP